jgi:hypothetical protein
MSLASAPLNTGVCALIFKSSIDRPTFLRTIAKSATLNLSIASFSAQPFSLI